MSKIKMIVTDLDMTILHTDKSISAYTQKIFKKCQEQNICTAIATARYYIGAEKYFDILETDYEITTDGTMTYKRGEFIYGNGFDLAVTNHILQEIRGIDKTLEITAATDSGVWWNSKNIEKSPILHKARYHDYALPLKEGAFKIVAELPNKTLADYIGEKYGCRVIGYRGESRYGFVRQGAGKVHSVHRLAGLLGIQMSEIIAFGDDENDVEMLSACGMGVAVENALPTVKQIADCICECNNADGVAHYIEKHILA